MIKNIISDWLVIHLSQFDLERIIRAPGEQGINKTDLTPGDRPLKTPLHNPLNAVSLAITLV